ncbi:MAG: histidinol dehydrogenase [Deltaproteobacteria bacterium]|nr:histidinol dehydrogenase [Deltaproteobacteria bacterium]
MRVLERGTGDYDNALRALARRGDEDLRRVEPQVREILDAVARDGDRALRALAERYDGGAPTRLALDREDCARAFDALEPAAARALSHAAARIRAFHEAQREEGLTFTDGDGVTLGWRCRPLERCGVYAPGGKARYPSSVLMAAIPARVAGVREVFLATPRPTALLLAAAHLADVDRVFDVGGAQAVGALAYGTETVPAVDKIVGPGNLYVACAKKLVFGRVAVDGIAGPSELLVVCDESASADVAAADLLSQAEHDEDAYPLAVVLTRAQAQSLVASVERRLRALPREAIARRSVEAHGYVFVTGDREEALRVASRLAVEHVSLQVSRPEEALEALGPAGAVFLGGHTPEAAGDYLAGPSHVLPTGGAVRFGSPLGVYDFVVRSSVIRYTPEALRHHAEDITLLARLEGLEGHALAVEARTRG